jgi:alpha-glucosidase
VKSSLNKFIKQKGEVRLKRIIALLVFLLIACALSAKEKNNFNVQSPDGNINVSVTAGTNLQWSVHHKGQQIITPSTISLQLEGDKVLGQNVIVKSAKTIMVDTKFNAMNYKRTVVHDQYNQITLECENDFSVVFRVYNDGVAYRFVTNKSGEIIINTEEANINFVGDHKAFVPYVWDYRDGDKFQNAFEILYSEINISKFNNDSIAILPLLVDIGNNKKVLILEADLEDYPGMNVNLNETGKGFRGIYPPYALETKRGGHQDLNIMVTKRADYIAKTKGTRNFPWRAIVISEKDIEILNTDMVQKLAAPSRIKDESWIDVGQVAWDWWNDNNIYHVDFEAGMNTPTYKYFIDFASANKIKYIIIDGGWSDDWDLYKVRPGINIQEIVDYGKSKNVGVILWASWAAILKQMDEAFPKFAAMGVKGWKIDFIDREDQFAVQSTYKIAELAAKYKLLVDYHGVAKPTGLQRTFPNVVGYEGVYGLEHSKWVDKCTENFSPSYDVAIPYIRNIAGPMDYTPGAMINATREDFRIRYHAPMSRGTRCHQIAEFVIFEVPIQMLADNPTNYMKEQECTDFITSIPTVFNETLPLDGKVAEYIAIARKKGDTWYFRSFDQLGFSGFNT